MQIIKYPLRSQWAEILARPVFDTSALNSTVSSVLDDIKERGDQAVFEYEEKFDKVKLLSLAVSAQEIAEAENLVSQELKEAIRQAKENIEIFHRSQIFETKNRDKQRCHLLAENRWYRKSRTLYSGGDSSFVFYSADACYSG